MSIFLDVLHGKPVERTPIWLMRQAGRYLPEYRALRAKTKNFLEFCQTSELAAEVTLQPIQRFALDAAIIFADILQVPHAMGMDLNFVESEGPIFSQPLRQAEQIKNLHLAEIEKFADPTCQAIRFVKKELPSDIALIGFAGSPWTVATYMVEGRGSKQFSIIKKMRYQNPGLLQQILEILISATTQWLQYQIKAGVDCIMLFDSWGGILSPQDYLDFSLAPMARVCANIRETSKIPIIIFSKGVNYPDDIQQLPIQAIGADWTMKLSALRKRFPNLALQGNLEPAALYADPAHIRQAVKHCLADYGYGHRHIFNLGHGILPDISPEHVAVLVDAVKEYSKMYHQ